MEEVEELERVEETERDRVNLYVGGTLPPSGVSGFGEPFILIVRLHLSR